MRFLQNLLASILGTIVAMGIFTLMFFFLLILVLSAGTDEKRVNTPHEGVLRITLEEPMKDYGGTYSFSDLKYEFEKYYGLNHLLKAIEEAAFDNNIKGISIEGTLTLTGIAQAKTIRSALQEFKESGKFVYAYGDFYTQKGYYLASAADSVFMNPSGDVDLKGLVSEVLFFKDFQDKSGIKIEVVRHGKYKSAVEPFLANEMSEANREQLSELLQDLWNSMVIAIGNSRTISPEKLQQIADDLLAGTAQGALQNNLVDKLAYHDEYEDALRRALKKSATAKIKYVDLPGYAEYVSKHETKKDKHRIAVIYAQGDILYGEGTDELVGQGILVKALQQVREDEDIKAVVLRINSPGGSALASELIWREAQLTRDMKPLIVSMGDVAASGGYYIACTADKIFAEPTTITGSIGVFGMYPNITGLADKLGIHAEQVTTNRQSLGYSFFEPMTDSYRTVATQGIETIYQTFLERVSEGRHLSIKAVDSIAQGRVWSGMQAKKIGLVDELGGLPQAIEYAAEAARVQNYTTENYPIYETHITELLERLLKTPMNMQKEELIKAEIGAEAYEILKKIRQLTQQKGVQARLPFELTIH